MCHDNEQPPGPVRRPKAVHGKRRGEFRLYRKVTWPRNQLYSTMVTLTSVEIVIDTIVYLVIYRGKGLKVESPNDRITLRHYVDVQQVDELLDLSCFGKIARFLECNQVMLVSREMGRSVPYLRPLRIDNRYSYPTKL